MLGNGGLYAVKRRKKPEQKIAKPPVKTNPSKRHRDRLNGELDRLTNLLPFSEEVRGRLDKLSVLRLSVGYLKVKNHFHAALQKNAWSAPSSSADGRNGQSVSVDGVSFSEGELLLKALNGFVLVVTSDGTVFYASPTIQDFLGFRQSDLVHQSVFDLVHVDDREMFKCQLHFALNPNQTDSHLRVDDMCSGGGATTSRQSFLPQHIPPENSSFLERNFCCRLRCLLDNSSGFLALNFHGHLKYLHCQGKVGADGNATPQLALFAIATPVQPPSVMEIRTKTLIFQTKHRMDFAPVGVDTRGKLVLGYSEMELITPGSGYQFIHAADMMYCADNHLRMIKTGESGFTFFRLLTKQRRWLWVQASARVVFKAGRPDFIIARQKPLTNEEGEEHLRQRRQQLPFNVTSGEGVLYDISLDTVSIPGPPGSTEEPTAEKTLDPASLLGSLLRQDHSVYTQPQPPSPPLPFYSQLEDPLFEESPQSLEQAFLDSHALLSVPGQLQASHRKSSVADLTSQDMIDSLDQILADIGDGGVEGLQVEEAELREWENALLKVNNERDHASGELKYLLANDVFSYVEEALRRETGGYVKGSDQTEVTHSLSAPVKDQDPGSVLPSNHELFSSSSLSDDHQLQIIADMTSNLSGFGERTLLGNVFGDVDGLTGLKGTSAETRGEARTLTPAQCRTAHTELASPTWPPVSSTYHYGNPVVSSQPHHVELPDQFHLSSMQNNNNVPRSCLSGLDVTNQSLQYNLMLNPAGTRSNNTQAHMGSQLQSPPQQCKQTMWQTQQQPQSFHRHTHSSHTPARVNSAAQSFQQRSPQMQLSSSSCMYGKRGHISNPDPPMQSNFLQVSAVSRGSGPNTAALFPLAPSQATLSSPGMSSMEGMTWPTAANHGMMQPCSANPQTAAHADAGQPSAAGAPLGPSENGSLQSSLLCWNGEGQISKLPLNGVVDPFTLPELPAGTINLSQNTSR